MNAMEKKLWARVNAVETLGEASAVEEELKESCIGNALYDELMMALSFIVRELYRR